MVKQIKIAHAAVSQPGSADKHCHMTKYGDVLVLRSISGIYIIPLCLQVSSPSLYSAHARSYCVCHEEALGANPVSADVPDGHQAVVDVFTAKCHPSAYGKSRNKCLMYTIHI